MTYTFIDLFAGIGGFHVAFKNLGFKCVMACEIDPSARNIYEYNHKPPLMYEDITKVGMDEVPAHDVLCAGFPCQPFSQAGYRKGFADTRGTLFFNILKILKEKRPRAFFLENVRYLKNHDDGKTFAVIKREIEKIGYSFNDYIVKATDHGLPQSRARLFMVGFSDGAPFVPPAPRPLKMTMSDILGGECSRDIGFTLRVGGRHSPISGRHNWDGYVVNGKERRITVREAAAMQGFPPDFVFPNSERVAMKQLGNSVAIPAVRDFATQILYTLESFKCAV